MSFIGTLHVGNLCNNNLKLCLALRKVGVDANFVHMPRMARRNPISDPRYYDSRFSADATWVHTIPEVSRLRPVQMVYELARLRQLLRRFGATHWVHAQTEYPGYVSLFVREYSAHSTGSDLREDYYRSGARAALLRRGYQRARIVFFNNIDLYRHEIEQLRRYAFLPNAVDISRYTGIAAPRPGGGRLRLLNAGRITLYDGHDRKGSRILLEALRMLGERDFAADLVLAEEDPVSRRFAEECRPLAPSIRTTIEPCRVSREAYLRQVSMADIVVDQFGYGAMGGTAMDCFAMGRIALVHNDSRAFVSCYGAPFPLGPLGSPSAVRDALLRLADPVARRAVEADLHQWLLKHHDDAGVARRFLREMAEVGVAIMAPVTGGELCS